MGTLNLGTDGTLQADTIKSGDGTRQYACATCWVNFDGTGVPTIRDSLNVASITDNGTGDYTINFSQLMMNTDYVATSGGSFSPTINQSNSRINVGGNATFTGVGVGCRSTSGSALDLEVISITVYGGDA